MRDDESWVAVHSPSHGPIYWFQTCLYASTKQLYASFQYPNYAENEQTVRQSERNKRFSHTPGVYSEGTRLPCRRAAYDLGAVWRRRCARKGSRLNMLISQVCLPCTATAHTSTRAQAVGCTQRVDQRPRGAHGSAGLPAPQPLLGACLARSWCGAGVCGGWAVELSRLWATSPEWSLTCVRVRGAEVRLRAQRPLPPYRLRSQVPQGLCTRRRRRWETHTHTSDIGGLIESGLTSADHLCSRRDDVDFVRGARTVRPRICLVFT